MISNEIIKYENKEIIIKEMKITNINV